MKNTVELIQPDKASDELKQLQLVCLPIVNFALGQAFSKEQLGNLTIKLEIIPVSGVDFMADVEVLFEEMNLNSFGLILRTKRIRNAMRPEDKVYNWKLLQTIFNVTMINLLIHKLRLDARLVQEDGVEYWLGDDISTVDLENLPFMPLVKEELEFKFVNFVRWIQDNFSEFFK